MGSLSNAFCYSWIERDRLYQFDFDFVCLFMRLIDPLYIHYVFKVVLEYISGATISRSEIVACYVSFYCCIVR